MMRRYQLFVDVITTSIPNLCMKWTRTMINFHRSTLLFLATIYFTSPVWADPLKDAEEALKKRDILGALSILEQATSAGNIAAKGMLSSYLLSLPAPHRNTKRACVLARETSDAGDSLGATTRA